MRVIAGAMLAAGMAAPGGSTCISDVSLFPDESGAIGVEVRPVGEGLEVHSVWLDKPAENVLVTGDRIIAVDGEPLAGMSFRSKVNAVRGPVDESVTIEFVRGIWTHEAELKRAALPYGPSHHVMGTVEIDSEGCFNTAFEMEVDGSYDGIGGVRIIGERPAPIALSCVLDRVEKTVQLAPHATVLVRAPRDVANEALLCDPLE